MVLKDTSRHKLTGGAVAVVKGHLGIETFRAKRARLFKLKVAVVKGHLGIETLRYSKTAAAFCICRNNERPIRN